MGDGECERERDVEQVCCWEERSRIDGVAEDRESQRESEEEGQALDAGVGVRGGRVSEERGDVDGVGSEVAEVEGVEVESWLARREVSSIVQRVEMQI